MAAATPPRRALVAGNWKMHRGGRDGAALARELLAALGGSAPAGADVLVLPPFPALGSVGEALRGTGVLLGAQDCHAAASGAHTGHVAAEMLRDWGCTHVLAGHSERRRLDGEGDDAVRAKVEAILRAGLVPVLCVGETLEERDGGRTAEVVQRQVVAGVRGLDGRAAAALVVAYEPVWAIGTGRTATPAQAVEGHAAARSAFAECHGAGAASALRILYGGSVNKGNAVELLASPGVDGALVGGASLEAAGFAAIVRAAPGAAQAASPPGG